MQSKLKALESEQPCVQDPLYTSQCWFLQLSGHSPMHPFEYLVLSQPEKMDELICLGLEPQKSGNYFIT